MLRENAISQENSPSAPIPVGPIWGSTLIRTMFLAAALWAFQHSLFQVVKIFSATCWDGSVFDLKPPVDRLILIQAVTYGPLLEEFIFRKLLLNFLEKIGINVVFSIFVSAALFSLGHVEDFAHADIRTIFLSQCDHFLSGLLYATIYVKTKRIWYPVVAHIVSNALVLWLQGWLLCSMERNHSIVSFVAYIVFMIAMLALIIHGVSKLGSKTFDMRANKPEKLS